LETIQATSSRASSFRRSRQHAFDALHLVFAPPGIGELAVFLNRQLEQLGPPLRSVPFELVVGPPFVRGRNMADMVIGGSVEYLDRRPVLVPRLGEMPSRKKISAARSNRDTSLYPVRGLAYRLLEERLGLVGVVYPVECAGDHEVFVGTHHSADALNNESGLAYEKSPLVVDERKIVRRVFRAPGRIHERTILRGFRVQVGQFLQDVVELPAQGKLGFPRALEIG